MADDDGLDLEEGWFAEAKRNLEKRVTAHYATDLFLFVVLPVVGATVLSRRKR